MKRELEQAAIEYAKINDDSSITNGFSIVKYAAFKAGAKWMKKQFCERDYIKGFKASIERIEVELKAMRKKYTEED